MPVTGWPGPDVPGVSTDKPDRIDAHADVVVVGAGACGLVAALRAQEKGADVVLLERDATASGSTSLSSGFVPAAGTRFQRSAGIEVDSNQQFTDDIQAKSGGRSAPALVELAVDNIAPALEWLADHHRVQWQVLDDFLYPGHSCHRMHAVPDKTGAGLQAALLNALHALEVPLLNSARVIRLYSKNSRHIDAVQLQRPDGSCETVACKALILACNGYGGNAELVARHIPEIADGQYFGHAGNTGDAIVWGDALGAASEHLSGYQGHGSVAHPHGILISWALMMEGAVQVNLHGQRFSNEHGGYSEQAVKVLAQPDGVAWNMYDQRIHGFAQGFPDYRQAVDAGAIITAQTLEQFAQKTSLPLEALQATLDKLHACADGEGVDEFGRRFNREQLLSGPFYGVKVTGALFHTQGGLMIDRDCRVLDRRGARLENLYAAGGAACGVSGPDVSGYLSGNGLLTAIAFGYVAGAAAAVAAAS
jgi:fumarate reductase flavoprotein subunit